MQWCLPSEKERVGVLASESSLASVGNECQWHGEETNDDAGKTEFQGDVGEAEGTASGSGSGTGWRGRVRVRLD